MKVETVKRIIGVARAGAVSCESEKLYIPQSSDKTET